MIANIWIHLRLWLAVALIAGLILDGVAFTALADNDGDWETASGQWDDEDDDAKRQNARSGSKRADRSSRAAQTQNSSGTVLGDDDDDDDDDDDCEIENVGAESDGFCDDQAIVRLAPGADVEAVNEDFSTDTIDTIDGQRLFLLQLPQNSVEATFAAQLAVDPRVDWAELNFIDQAPEGSPRRFFPSSGDIPQPGSLDQAYALPLIGAPAALACANGRGVTVAVIDSGLDADHPAFANTVLRGEWNAFTGEGGRGNVDDVGNSEDDDNDGLIDEMTGHGTHVAGIVTQIAPSATIMPIKALDSDGVGQAFYLARAIYRALGQGADVINLSLGSTADTTIVREATDDALAASIFVTAAAGNSGVDGPREYPATQDGVFGIAATDEADRRADFTSVHPSLSLSAPGAGIVSAFPIGEPPGAPLGSPYALWSGTSMATPWVAGAAALLLDRNPAWTASDVAARLRNTAAPINGPAGGMGSGRLNAAAAVDCAPQAAPVTATADDIDIKDKKKKAKKNAKKKDKKNKKNKKRKNRR